MKIIHIVHGKVNPNGPNGISRVVYYLNLYQKKQGDKSEIWAFVDGIKKHETLVRDENVTVEMFPRLTIFNKVSHPIIKKFREEAHQIDIVHFHMIWFLDKNILAKELNTLKLPFVVTTHGTYSKPVSYKGKKMLARYLYENDFLNRAAAIHALTPEEVTYLIHYGVKRPCFVIPNGMELRQIPEKLSNDYFSTKSYNRKVKIGWIGVFREDKNLDLLIQACSLLPDEVKNNCQFILMGPDHKGNRARLSEMANKLNCSSSFDFFDAIFDSEKYNALNSFDVYIMTSSSEGLSLAILDAMALGKPCILTRGCNMTYYYNKGFYEMCECVPQEIASAIERMYEKKDEWVKMGDAGKELIHTVFNWDAIVKKMAIEYKKVLAK